MWHSFAACDWLCTTELVNAYWVSLNSGIERKWFFVSADLGGYCSEGRTCGPDGCKSDTLLLHDDGLLLCHDLSNRNEGHSVTLKGCRWIMQRSMPAQGLERLFDGSETGNECAAVISQSSKASYFADSYRLPSFMQSNTPLYLFPLSGRLLCQTG